MKLAQRLLELGRGTKARVATAESCTGGMIAAAITDRPGSADIFDRGFVTYSVPAKVAMLGVRPETLSLRGAVSEETAREMAEGALARSDATVAVSVTGVAGPGEADGVPEGRVCFGLARTDGATRTETVEYGARGRDKVRQASRDHALRLLIAAVAADQR